MTDFDDSPLRSAIERAAHEQHCSLGDLTVLASQNDPFRLDTPARHRDGAWLSDIADRLDLRDRTIHLRGLHYSALSLEAVKPNGEPYQNIDADWLWISGDAAKAARFLGYIGFDQINDQRNSPPVIREYEPPDPGAYLSTELGIEIPRDITPTLYTEDFRGSQPVKLVMFGEKSSLADVLLPLAEEYEADVYLPTGEISDTLLHRMAQVSADDGRPMVVLTFSDCDPAGWQMPISIARKLQAFRELIPEMPEFQVHRIALVPDQVRDLNLPSTPLKSTERRADKWTRATGTEQTEIDALASLRPDLLEQIAREALDGWFDQTLADRVARYRSEWLARARDMIAATFDMDRLAEIRRDAEERLAGMRREIEALNDALRIDVDEDDLPPIELPEATGPEGNPMPLIDSRWSFARQTYALINSKRYGA